MLDMEFVIDLCATLFPLKMAHALVSRFSEFQFRHFNKIHWKRTADNIVKAMNGSVTIEEARGISLEGFKNLTHFMADYRYVAHNDPATLNGLVADIECHGRENIQGALQAKQPVIAVSIHMGNFILGFLKLCEFIPKGSKVTIIKWKEWTQKEEAAYKNFKETGVDLHVLRLDEKPGLAALRDLRSGSAALTLCDIAPPGVRTVAVDFFNTKALFPLGPAELALMCHGMILPLFTARGENQKLFIKVEEPIHAGSFLGNQERGAAAQQITQKLVTRIESWIRQYPDQWHFWPILELLWQTN